MANPRRIQRLQSLIKARVAEILQRRMKDPRLGFVTITAVELDGELMACKVYWSVLGGERERQRNERALQHARRFVQREVAEILPTRTAPELRFVFDDSIEGSIRIQELIREVNPNPEDSSEDGPQRLDPPGSPAGN